MLLRRAEARKRALFQITTPAGPRSDQRAEFVARLHILQAAREEAGQMLADHRIGCVGQAEFLQSGPPCLARQVVESGPGEEPVEDDLRQRGAIERRGNCLGKQAGAARGRKLLRAAMLTLSPIRSPSLSSTTSPRWMPTRNSMRRSGGRPALRSIMPFCISIAQRTASTTLLTL